MSENEAQPWWKFGHAWLVFAGPAVVVVASFITLYLAITIPDPVIKDRLPTQASHNAEAETRSTFSLAPAMQARNHAATGVIVPSKP